jgi:hypothetical protein
MRNRRAVLSRVGLAGLLTVFAVPEVWAAERETLPPGVEQILPRGQIAAVLDPQFVAASAAKIPDDAWILGVVIEGEAKAYSLNLLNRHEVVNDQSGETGFAAVW